MIYNLSLTLSHPSWEQPIRHVHNIEVETKKQVLDTLDLSPHQITYLRSTGKVTWVDKSGVKHKLELKKEDVK